MRTASILPFLFLCHRLGKPCEPSINARKRKARTQLVTQSRPAPPRAITSHSDDPVDDIAALLRTQAAETTASLSWDRQDSLQPGTASKAASGGSSVTLTPGDTSSSVTVREEDPDLVITMEPSIVQFLRRADLGEAASTIFTDVTVHGVSVRVADESLRIFKRAFLSTFPFVHIPAEMNSTDLLMQKPFLWLVIMALTAKHASQQFAMEQTIWNIISRRIIAQQHASLDLLLGLICFASWSHYFKQDKPFMTMLSQVAIALALELDLHKDIPMRSDMTQGANSSEELRLGNQRPQVRSLEDRRTFLAVFHLNSATWASYRKTEPLRWTHYSDECLSTLAEGSETELDILLTMQIKCQIITNSLTCPFPDEAVGNESLNGPPPVLMAAMKGRLNDIKQSLPPQIRSARTSQFYLHSTETSILECFVSKKPPQNDRTGASQFRRIQELQSVLDSVERWLSLFLDMPLLHWTGVSMDIFTQFTHNLVVLFRLTTLDEPGWDIDQVRKRADVFSILDRACDLVDRIPGELGLMDADGQRSGLFFKTNYLFRAIKQLFLRQARAKGTQVEKAVTNFGQGVEVESSPQMPAYESTTTTEDLIMDLSNEPWLADLLEMNLDWNYGAESLPWSRYSEY
ncbi:hypothetical protein N0V93_008318 [Gnomoniopsis smithogilvyi]|uniref:Transcription factor domain-containing protein n=1 Tax=Gnomoniopsis smithogilvyi TaxID=1191159 RepID=A0A9W8YMS1_9PEZI|nr:hypothetical protein N0V93_008318 [Gnomoniopsis smithogilvyi]